MVISGHDDASLAKAVAVLQAGGLIGLPTETVYGLAADACSAQAVAKIFAAKGRPSDHPLIVHVHGAEQARQFAHGIPAFAERLMQAFWPGTLTLILPRLPGIAAASAGGQDSVGLRCPSHPVANALLKACAHAGIQGLAAPSANLFGRVSPTTAAHVQSEFGDDLLVLDGGACAVGIESTIVDCTRSQPVLLRPGILTRAEIEHACGQLVRDAADLAQPAPRASGTLESHYAPNAPVRLMNAKMLQTALDLLDTDATAVGVWSRTALRSRSTQLNMRRMPDDALAAANQLFGVLRGFDDQGCKLIWVELPPDTPEWEGVRDRLQRASV